MLERIQNNVIANDIIAEAVLAGPDTILTLALENVLKLLDVVPVAAVVRIV
ncbi:MAG TPA: hypothetical protein VLY03_05240 [Bacteroidota bacterium]|nr:hypothetical protein [Bacteroidota bacterium]